MNRTEIFEKVKEITSDLLGLDPTLDSFEESSSFQDDLGADSLDQVELIMNIESHFGISISDDVAESLDTVGKAVDYLEKVVG